MGCDGLARARLRYACEETTCVSRKVLLEGGERWQVPMACFIKVRPARCALIVGALTDPTSKISTCRTGWKVSDWEVVFFASHIESSPLVPPVFGRNFVGDAPLLASLLAQFFMCAPRRLGHGIDQLARVRSGRLAKVIRTSLGCSLSANTGKYLLRNAGK